MPFPAHVVDDDVAADIVVDVVVAVDSARPAVFGPGISR